MRVALAACLLMACTDESVEFRICNDSGFEMTDILLGNERVDHLANGECTPYQVRDSILSSPSTTLTVDDELYFALPIDSFGSVTGGRWTYHLRVSHGENGGANGVDVQLVEH